MWFLFLLFLSFALFFGSVVALLRCCAAAAEGRARRFLTELWLVKRLPVFQEEFHQFTQAGKSGFKGDSQTVARIDLAAAAPPSMLMASFRRVDTPADAANVVAAQTSAKRQRCVMTAPPCCLIVQPWCPRRCDGGSSEGVSAVFWVFLVLCVQPVALPLM